MAITTLSSREFNQDTGRAKSAAQRGPVFITDRGRPAHVLLTFADYQRLTGGQDSIIDLLGRKKQVDSHWPALETRIRLSDLPRAAGRGSRG